MQNLKSTQLIPIQIKLPLIREGYPDCYNPMNPSIQKSTDGYHLICRTVNFSQTKGTSYQSRNPEDPTIRTKNFLVRYDRSFNLLSQREIVEELPRNRPAKLKLPDWKIAV